MKKNNFEKAIEALVDDEIAELEALPVPEHEYSESYLRAIEKIKAKGKIKRPVFRSGKLTAALVAACLLTVTLCSVFLGIQLSKPEPYFFVIPDGVIDTVKIQYPSRGDSSRPGYDGSFEGTFPPLFGGGGDGNFETGGHVGYDPGIEYGFLWHFENTFPMASQFTAAYKGKQSIFNEKEEIKLDFYYGFRFTDLEVDRQYYNVPVFDLYFAKLNGNEYTRYHIKTVEENLISEKYKTDWVYDFETNICEIKYSHHETIVIPRELFTDNEGCFYFFYEGINFSSLESGQPDVGISPISIYYKKDGGKIILSTEKFK